MNNKITYRDNVTGSDPSIIRKIIESSGYFNEGEVETAVELIDERLAKGLKSGYYFLFADESGRTIGYTCYGPIACTKSSYDLYWIAVHESVRGKHIGSQLLKETEQKIKAIGGTRIYVETSSREQYNSTRSFYLRNDYIEEAVITDFYDVDDSKVIFVKVL